ncbi:MAG: hypothetical protein AAFP70_19450 [Calditrichota bacterium]
MDIRVITLKFDPESGQFDDQPLKQLVRNRRVIEMNDYFFQFDGLPHLTIVLKLDSAEENTQQNPARRLGDKRRI